MAKQTINPGVAPTGAGGDTFRSGSAKLQANDNELYTHLGASDGALTAAKTRNALGLGTAATKNAGLVLGDLIEVGSFGIGLPPDLGSQNLNDVKSTGIYRQSSSSYGATQNYPGSSLGFLEVFNRLGNTNRPAQRFTEFTSGIQYWRSFSYESSTWTAWLKFYNSSNTVVDSNGFIKAASPVLKLFLDKIELNGEAQQQGISFEKLGIGNYLIKGSSGFAQEGWYIETPKDANGNVLFSVIYTTLENGNISVKTYKKKFDFETVSIVADLDNPVDITESRWIDLRLQELPQPEIEIPESIAPPEVQPTGLAEAVATVMESYHDPEQ